MDLQRIQEQFKYLTEKDAKLAKKYVKDEDWESLLTLIDTEIDEADTDVQIASEEDNGQLVKAKSELLDQLMKLRYAVEDYLDCIDPIEDEDFYPEDY